MTQASSISLLGSKTSLRRILKTWRGFLKVHTIHRPAKASGWSLVGAWLPQRERADFYIPMFKFMKRQAAEKLKSSCVLLDVSQNTCKDWFCLCTFGGAWKPSQVSAVHQQPWAAPWSEREEKAKMWDALTHTVHMRAVGLILFQTS